MPLLYYAESCFYSELWLLYVGMVPTRPCCGLLPGLGFSRFCLWDHVYSQMAWHNALGNEIGFGQEAACPTYRVVPKLFRWLTFLLKWKEMNSIQIIGWLICILAGSYPISNSKLCILTWRVPNKFLNNNLISLCERTCCRTQLSTPNINKAFKCEELSSLTSGINISSLCGVVV